MTGADRGQGKLPLGVGSIIGDSFSILFRKFLTVMGLSAGPMVLSFLASGLLIGWDMTLQGEPTEFTDISGAFWTKYALVVVVQMAIYGITTALLVQLAYDAKLGSRRTFGQYLSPALSAALPIVVLMIATMLLVSLGSLALIVPGLWLYAVFSVTTPAIVIERAGFRGMGRSATLTKDYRWPILGTLFLVLLLTFVLTFVMQFIVGMVIGAVGTAGAGIVIGIVIMALLQSIALGLSSIAAALIFARLKEIKEGVSVDQLAAVFD
ncbi:MAG: hypothetical protein KDK10_18280 [Maritimibacter sp.]|nr:hypothetical protein [Maritimibacter sp.]